jgi:hypothetical protein
VSASAPGTLDSAVYFVRGARVGAHGSTPTAIPYTPAVEGVHDVLVRAYGTNVTQSPVQSTSSLTAAAVPDSVTVEFELREMHGDSLITSPASIPIDGSTLTFTNGRATRRFAKGKTMQHGLVSNGATFDGDYSTVNDGRAPRANFPRFVRAAGAAAGTDTVTYNQDATVRIERASKTDAHFNEASIQSWFDGWDNPVYGNEVMPSGPLAVYGMLTADARIGNSMTMSTAQRDGLRQWFASLTGRFAQYQITTDSGSTPEIVSITTPTATVMGPKNRAMLLIARSLGALGNARYYSQDYGLPQGLQTSATVGIDDAQSLPNYSFKMWKSEAEAAMTGLYADVDNGRDDTFFKRFITSEENTPFDVRRENIQRKLSIAAADRRAASPANARTPYFSYRP